MNELVEQCRNHITDAHEIAYKIQRDPSYPVKARAAALQVSRRLFDLYAQVEEIDQAMNGEDISDWCYTSEIAEIEARE